MSAAPTLFNRAELRQSPLSGLCLAAYAMVQGKRRWRLAGKVFGLLDRLEGGQMFTYTCRHLLLRDYEVEIGAYSYGTCFTPGHFPPKVRVGRYTSIGPGVRVFNQNHPIDHLSTHPFFYEAKWGFIGDLDLPRHTLEIGPDVWMGYNAVITPSCRRIGVGAVIGAGAVVTKDVPDFAVVAGVPARIVRMRFSEEVCQAVLDSRWWERTASDLRGCSGLFEQTLDNPAPLHPLITNASDIAVQEPAPAGV